MPADPRGVVDIVPVDYVADGILALHRLERVPETLHLVAGHDAVSNAELIELACRCFDRPPPELRADASMPNVDEALAYLPYFDVHTTFDDRNARELLRPLGVQAAPLPDYFPTIIGYALAARWGKRRTSRETAVRIADESPAARPLARALP